MAKQEKLKNYEIQALAQKVFEEVRNNKTKKIKELHGEDIKKYVTEYKRLDDEKRAIGEQQDELTKKIRKKLNLSYIYSGASEDTIIENLAKYPSASDIEREIILKGIFSDKSELEEFIKELVKKFS